MFLALGSVLLLGTSLGVLADRLVFSADSDAGARSVSGEIWFDCSQEPTTRPESEREERRIEYVKDMREELLLDESQSTAVHELLRVHGDGARAFWYETRSEYCTMLSDMRAEVAELLTADQKELFTKRLKRLDEKMRRQHQRSGDRDR